MLSITKSHLSAACYSRTKMPDVAGAVIHFISAVNIDPSDPFNIDTIVQIFETYRVSAHYLIGRVGEIYELVPLPHRAHHAGRSLMRGVPSCNKYTVGIELVGGTGVPYTAAQITALVQLLSKLMATYGFDFTHVMGHDTVRAAWNKAHPEKQSPVKVDPGPHFPWLDIQSALLSEVLNE